MAEFDQSVRLPYSFQLSRGDANSANLTSLALSYQTFRSGRLLFSLPARSRQRWVLIPALYLTFTFTFTFGVDYVQH